jgi:CRP-like cAMP-binding protein
MENMRGAVYVRILRLLVVLCLLTHWLACGLYLLATLNAHEANWLDRALQEAELLGADAPTRYDEYLLSFNNAILVLVGNGFSTSSSSERIFCAMATLLGSFVQAAIFGNAAQVIAAMGATAARHQARADATMETARYLGIPEELQTRMADYFSFMSGCSHPGEEGMSRLAELSPPLHRDIMVHLYGEVIRGVPLFRGLPAGLIAACAARVRPRIFMAGEAVFAAGELSREMYFLVHGTVEVCNAAGRRLTLLEDGAYFGELALLANVQRSASVTTLTVCDICIFTSADLAAVLDDFPDAEPRMRARALRRMAQLQRESEAVEAGGVGARRRSVAAATADLDHDSTLMGLAPLLSGELSPRRRGQNGGGGAAAAPPPLMSQASLSMRPRRRGSLLAEAVAASSPRRAHSTAVLGSDAAVDLGNLSPRRAPPAYL